MNYYIQGDAANADKIKAAFEKLGVASNANRYNYKNDYVLYYSAGGMMNMIDANGSWANIIKTHPDYKELELPVQPKLKVGDWLVYKYGNCFAGGFRESQVVKVKDGVYYFSTGTTGSCKFIEESCRLWSIADAKDGDVLATNNIICIFKKLDKDGYYIISPCVYTVKDGFEVIDDEDDSIGSFGFSPATKEDRELLFRKMKEAGYEWDDEKKELRKIKPHYDIKNFQPFDKVLVKDSSCEKWVASLFSNYDKDSIPHHFVCIDSCYVQCIPFEGNKHLLGTIDPCDERFINW